MIEIIAFNTFSKRKNSTKQPVDSEGTVMQISLKGECSLVNPNFFISGVERWCYIKAFGFYYFVDRIAYDINGAQYINCSIDVLASFKQQILNTSAFVIYSSSDYNVNIKDNRIAQTINKIIEKDFSETIFVGNHTYGCYCITTTCVKYGSTGWIVRSDRFEELVDNLINAGSSVWQSLIEMFSDAIGSIIGARYMPISYDYFDEITYGDEIALGDWNSGITGIPTSDGYVIDSYILSIPWTYSDFRRCSEFTRFMLQLPFIGYVELSPENLIGKVTLRVAMVLSMITGKITYNVLAFTAGDDEPIEIGSYNAECGRQVPVATDQINAVGVLAGGVTAGTSAYTGMMKNLAMPLGLGGYGGGMLSVAGVLAGLATASIAANKQDFVTIGGYSGNASEVLINQVGIISVANESVQNPSAMLELYGRPCMKERTLNGLTGYVETTGFDIDIPAISEVRDLINSAMDKGVYIE